MNDEIPANLAVVNCCATCTWFRSCFNFAWCGRYDIHVLPQTKCDTFERRSGTPLWIITEPMEPKAS